MVMTMSAPLAAPAAEPAATTPACAAAATAAGLMSWPCTRCPALTRLAAMGCPIWPRPMKLTTVIPVLPRKAQLGAVDAGEMALDFARGDVFEPGRRPGR